jgi:hypothetical protein
MGLLKTAQRSRSGGVRRVLMALGALTLLGVLFPSGSASAQEYPPGILPPGEWTEAEANWLVGEVEWAEQELPAFTTARLQELGFVNIGVVAPGGYGHWTNVNYFTDSHFLNPQYPESVVTQGSQVVAAMFFMGPATTLENLPSLVSWIPGWHDHPELCSDETGRVVGASRPDGTCAVGQPVLTAMTHVWIVDNECGHRFGGVDAGGLHCEYEHDH